MSFFDTFKGKQYKQESEDLRKQLEEIQALLTPEMQDAAKMQDYIRKLHSDKERLEAEISGYQNRSEDITKQIDDLNEQVRQKKSLLVYLDDEIIVQEFGLYHPHFEFATALGYKEALETVRKVQKDLIKNGKAVTGNVNWTVNGSASQGRKMVSDTQKLLMRAFNSECDEIVSNVKYTNFDSSKKRIESSVNAISKLGATMSISISPQYADAKMKELHLAFEYQMKKQEEKEEQKEARERLCEAAKLQKQIEEERKKIEKEQTHYQTAYEKICIQFESDPNNAELMKKKEELEKHLVEIEKSLKDIDYREANQKAGYVYVISNIGSFGKDVYKIGMTRRLDPQERIDELGDASVPFNFDVHAMIFSDDAPALEAALHRAFADRKVNMVNIRREFFHVTLDEIKDVIRANFDKTVEFIDIPDAEQYRISKKMKGLDEEDS